MNRKALIFDASTPMDSTLKIARMTIERVFKSISWDVNSFTLCDLTVAPCLGCFDCWLKTPGICAINDAGRHTTKAAVQSDLWFFLSPVTFGGYASELKKVVDRILPIFVPVFTKIRGETHHKLRFNKHPILVGIGLLENQSDQRELIFEQLIGRNAINFHSPSNMSGFLLEGDSDNMIEKKMIGYLRKLEVTI